MNFLSAVPDNRHLDVRAAVDRLQQDHHPVENRLELGDVVVLLDEQGVVEAPSCRLCHGATHTLHDSRGAASPMSRTNITKACARYGSGGRVCGTPPRQRWNQAGTSEYRPLVQGLP